MEYFNHPNSNSVAMVTDTLTVYQYTIVKYTHGEILHMFHKYTCKGRVELMTNLNGYLPSNEILFNEIRLTYYSTIKAQGKDLAKHLGIENHL